MNLVIILLWKAILVKVILINKTNKLKKLYKPTLNNKQYIIKINNFRTNLHLLSIINQAFKTTGKFNQLEKLTNFISNLINNNNTPCNKINKCSK